MTLAINHLRSELLPNPDASWVSVDYIHAVAAAFLLRLFVSVSQKRGMVGYRDCLGIKNNVYIYIRCLVQIILSRGYRSDEP